MNLGEDAMPESRCRFAPIPTFSDIFFSKTSEMSDTRRTGQSCCSVSLDIQV